MKFRWKWMKIGTVKYLHQTLFKKLSIIFKRLIISDNKQNNWQI